MLFEDPGLVRYFESGYDASCFPIRVTESQTQRTGFAGFVCPTPAERFQNVFEMKNALVGIKTLSLPARAHASVSNAEHNRSENISLRYTTT